MVEGLRTLSVAGNNTSKHPSNGEKKNSMDSIAADLLRTMYRYLFAINFRVGGQSFTNIVSISLTAPGDIPR
jgi:hypothetical protein